MSNQPIIIKKVKKHVHAHHGGAWKIAYADFVTAMMAFFLLMWLISMTTPEQKQGLADYFAPPSISRSNSGSGGVMGGTAFESEGSRMPGSTPRIVMTVSTPAAPKSPDIQEGGHDGLSTGREDAAEEAPGARSGLDEDQRDRPKDVTNHSQQFQSAAESLRQAMRDMPELTELSKNLILEETPDGLRIQIIDQEGRSMFPSGHSEPYERTRRLLQEVAKAAGRLPNRLAITGHTDATPLEGDPGYSNWELTADRANATRRILEDAGVEPERIYEVAGKADSEPLFADDPYLPANRRVSILLLREAPVLPPGFQP